MTTLLVGVLALGKYSRLVCSLKVKMFKLQTYYFQGVN